jgi:chitin synthase
VSQDVEYRMSHFMDKPLEHFLGYITVLPGAFSAYRWSTIQSDDVLWTFYFRYLFKDLPKTTHNLEDDLKEWKVSEANMYLAEDRVLCYAIFV